MTDKTNKKKLEVIATPEGDVVFSSLRNARKSDYKDAKPEFSMRVYFKATTPGTNELKAKLKKINKDLIITENKEGESIVKNEGDFIINARSQERPTVLDKDGDTIEAENVPMIESATVKLLVTPFESKSGKGGGINLAGVQLLEVTEYEGQTKVDTDELKKALQAKHS